MKKGVKRDSWFIVALLGVWATAMSLSWSIAYLSAGPPTANQQARELYAEGIGKLFGVFFVIGTGIVSAACLWRLGWLTSNGQPTSAQDQSEDSNIATGEPQRAEDANLPSRIGWGILFGFVLIMAVILVTAALSRG